MGIVGRGGGGTPTAGLSGRPCGEEGGDWVLENGLGLVRLGKRSTEEAVSATVSGSEVGKRSKGKARARLNSRVEIGYMGRECSARWLIVMLALWRKLRAGHRGDRKSSASWKRALLRL